MSNHVLTVTANGDIHYTRNDLEVESIIGASAALSTATKRMERITDIQFSVARQKFYIFWLRGPYARRSHSFVKDQAYLPEDYQTEVDGEVIDLAPAHDMMTFESYETAVAHEIRVVAAMRKQGILF